MTRTARLGSDCAVFVTGATGFVGSALLERLAQRGVALHALVRKGSSGSAVPRVACGALPPVTWHTGDLLDEGSIRRAIGEFAARARRDGQRTFVVHGAARISYRTPDAEASRRANVEGTRFVLEASKEQFVGRALLVSSVVAVGYASSAGEALDEEASYNGARLRCHYVTTKRAAEDYALSVADELELVVVNPGAIFGPSRAAARRSNTTLFLQRLARGTFGNWAPPGSLSVVGVDDVAQGIESALVWGRSGRRYLLCESSWTHLELMRLAARELGVRAPKRALPRPLWNGLVAGAALVDRWRALEEATPQALRLLGEHFRFDSARARQELGWEPRPFPEVLAQTVRWMRDEGLGP